MAENSIHGPCMAPNLCDGHTALDTRPKTHIPMQLFKFTRAIQVTGQLNFHLFVYRYGIQKFIPFKSAKINFHNKPDE